jgi:transcriptional regulator with XRE-family HTH domain
MTISPDTIRAAEEQYRAAAGGVFRRLRGDASLRDFADRVGVAHTSIYAVERGDATPSLDTLVRVAQTADLSLAALLALILDEMRGPSPDGSLNGVLEASAGLSAAQRAEVQRFIEWLRWRDAERVQPAAG